MLPCQVHRGNKVEAAAATEQLQWKQMITLSVEVLKMPLMWYFSIAAFLWGECAVKHRPPAPACSGLQAGFCKPLHASTRG
jgi:hypothetical protein